MVLTGDTELQPALPINQHRIVGLLKTPKFIAQQWRSQPPNAIVGVVLPSSTAETHVNNSASATKGLDPRAGDNGVFSNHRVVVSSESIASHMAQASLRSTLSGRYPHQSQQSTPQLAPSLSQLYALRNIRTLKTKSSDIDRLYLMTRRMLESNNSALLEDHFPVIRTGIPSVNELFVGFDDPAPDPKCPSQQTPSSITKGLAVEAKIFGIVTLTPSLDNTYHTLLRSRHQQSLTSGRMTKESKYKPSLENDDHSARLFRYYQPGAGFANIAAEFDTNKRKKNKLRSRKLDDPDMVAAREDDTKQRLFDAFEQEGTGGTITLQDMVKLTGQSQHFVKSIVEQIAVPVRTAEHKRTSYILKPEFQSDIKRMRID